MEPWFFATQANPWDGLGSNKMTSEREISGFMDVSQYIYHGDWIIGRTYDFDGLSIKFREYLDKTRSGGFYFTTGSIFNELKSIKTEKISSDKTDFCFFEVTAKENHIISDNGEIKVVSRLKLVKKLDLYDIIWKQIEYSENAKDYQRWHGYPCVIATDDNDAQMFSDAGGITCAASGNKSTFVLHGYGMSYATAGSHNMLATRSSSGSFAASGANSFIVAAGAGSNFATSGEECELVIDGADSNIASSGKETKINSIGNNAHIVVANEGARISTDGADNIISIIGRYGEFSGRKGTHISVADFRTDGKCHGFITGCIGENGLKENTKYTVKSGRFVEVQDQPNGEH